MEKKRAIALAGGGPVVGLHIGALRRLNEAKMNFDVWALSCIGEWAGAVYNQFDDDKDLTKTEAFFRHSVFRSDVSYSRFPINNVFGMDWLGNWQALVQFAADPKSYDNLFLPNEMLNAAQRATTHLFNPSNWSKRGDWNDLVLELLAANPFVRYYCSMMFLSKIDGLARLYYPESSLLERLNFDNLRKPNKPFMYHNAWNLSKKRLEQFANRPEEFNNNYKDNWENRYRQMSAQSMCACSALPFVEQTVKIDGDVYCEGALIDTVNLKRLLDDHCYLDEVWICRIVDDAQVTPPENLHDALANLCQLFAATVGEDDIELFRLRCKKLRDEGKQAWTDEQIIEIEVHPRMNFDWTHSNLDQGIKNGYEAVDEKLKEVSREELRAELKEELREELKEELKEDKGFGDKAKDLSKRVTGKRSTSRRNATSDRPPARK